MNNDLIVKQVDFQGANLLACKKNSKIYVGISYICNGIGLSNGQFRRQKQNLKEDLVLKKGVTNLCYPTKGGEQEVLCIELDYLPLWLAKIAITPKIKKDNPSLANKLIEYQLRAKDVLAKAFIENKTLVPKTLQEALRAYANTLDEKEIIQKENNILKPKAEQFEKFLYSDISRPMKEVANVINAKKNGKSIGRNMLFEFLRSISILTKNNLPYQKFIDRGYFDVIEIIIQKQDIIKHQTKVTPKGFEFIAKKLEEHGYEIH